MPSSGGNCASVAGAEECSIKLFSYLMHNERMACAGAIFFDSNGAYVYNLVRDTKKMSKYASNIETVLSRRRYPEICKWWQRTTSGEQIPLSRYFTEVTPSGQFHAKETTQYNYDKRNVGDFRFGSNMVSIETPDDVSEIRPDSIVLFEGVMYRVESKSKRKVRKTRECMRKPLFVYILNLVR